MRGVVEDYRHIDVRRWRRKGLLRPGERFVSSWYRDEREESSINVAVTESAVRLSYTVGLGTERRQDLSYEARLDWTPCHFGGARPWFICPGRGCGRRVARLYFCGRYFLCRHCQELGYGEARPYRLLRRVQRIRRRLGGSTALSYPFPPRPKGLWRRTYRRLRLEAEALEREGWEGTDATMAGLLRGMAEALGIDCTDLT